MKRVEILYLAWNRLAYTQASFELLRQNTNWDRVSRLIVYDNCSTDGTAEYLQEAGMHMPVRAFEWRSHAFGAPAAVMNDYLATTEAEWFVKLDNDIAVPPLWLESMISVTKRHDVDLLGMDGGRHGVADPWQPPKNCGVEYGSHIGGVGLMRVEAFHSRPPIMARGRQGFTHWQERHDPKRGWVTPGLAVAQLDLIPEEPWRSLAAEYVELGWARSWTPYSALHPWWSGLLAQLEDPAPVRERRATGARR